jgi:hypothetical protein
MYVTDDFTAFMNSPELQLRTYNKRITSDSLFLIIRIHFTPTNLSLAMKGSQGPRDTRPPAPSSS